MVWLAKEARGAMLALKYLPVVSLLPENETFGILDRELANMVYVSGQFDSLSLSLETVFGATFLSASSEPDSCWAILNIGCDRGFGQPQQCALSQKRLKQAAAGAPAVVSQLSKWPHRVATLVQLSLVHNPTQLAAVAALHAPQVLKKSPSRRLSLRIAWCCRPCRGLFWTVQPVARCSPLPHPPKKVYREERGGRDMDGGLGADQTKSPLRCRTRTYVGAHHRARSRESGHRLSSRSIVPAVSLTSYKPSRVDLRSVA